MNEVSGKRTEQNHLLCRFQNAHYQMTDKFKDHWIEDALSTCRLFRSYSNVLEQRKADLITEDQSGRGSKLRIGGLSSSKELR